MKSIIAIAFAALFVTGTAFAQDVHTKKGPIQTAQSLPVQVARAGAGGAAMGAGEATGVAGTGLSASGIVAVGAGVSVVVAASGSNSTTNH